MDLLTQDGHMGSSISGRSCLWIAPLIALTAALADGQTPPPAGSSALGDFLTSKASPTTLTVAPGVYRAGGVIYTYSGSTTFMLAQYTITGIAAYGWEQATLTLSGNVVNGSVHFGDTFYIGGATGVGCSGLNGLQTVVNLPAANEVSINWNPSGCSYTSNSATFGANAHTNQTAYLYGDYAGNLTLDMPAAAGLIAVGSGAATPITIQESKPGFDPTGVPIASIQLGPTGNGSWNAVVDARAFLAGTAIVAGAGMSIHEAGGAWFIGIDKSIVPELGAGNFWTGANDFGAAESTAPFKISASAPAKCSVGQYYFNKNNAHTYACTAEDTWSQVDGGGARTTTETYDLSLKTCPYGTPGGIRTPPPARCEPLRSSTIAFGAAARAAARGRVIVPMGWSGGVVNLYLYGNAAESASAPAYRVQTRCYSPSAAGASLNTAQTLTVTPNPETGDFMAELRNVTMTGCSAGNVLDILINRASTGADELDGAYLTIVRSL